MKKQSFVRTMKILMWVQVVTVTVLLIFFAFTTFRSAEREADTAAENFLDIYATQIENRLQKMRVTLSTIVSESADLNLLASADETQRYYAALRLSEKINDIMVLDQSADMYAITDGYYDTRLEANNGQVALSTRNCILDFFGDYAKTGTLTSNWQFQLIDGTVYLFKASLWNQRVVAAVVSVDSLLDTIPDVNMNDSNFVLTDAEYNVWGYSGTGLFDEVTGIPITDLDTRSKLVNHITLENKQLNLYSFSNKSDIIGHLYGNALIILLIIVLLFLFDFHFMKFEKHQIIHPMGEMVRDMEKIEAGDYRLRVAERDYTQEFSLLAKTFNKLMDEIIHLKIQFYEKKLALSDAEQKYIRLQIRPHFFLNAMATISGLSSKGKNKEIESYINALSKNIRYMFSSGLHTVAVKDEIRHVENYFEMQELRYPECLFYFISLPQELGEWQIPQMLIHTLIENEYKYAFNQDTSLMVLIKVSMVVHDGEDMLLIEVEDDGQGYPEEVLEYMNNDVPRQKQDGTRVGLWSIKRLLELMYDRNNLIEISNVEPHGALNKIYIPKIPVNERGREYLEEQGIQ